MPFADIGCGTGLFTFPASEIGGPDAAIYAADISPDMLSDVSRRIGETDASNIKAVLCDSYDFKLAADSVDFTLICTVLHEVEDKQRFVSEAFRICLPGGKLAVIEFGDKDVGFGRR